MNVNGFFSLYISLYILISCEIVHKNQFHQLSYTAEELSI